MNDSTKKLYRLPSEAILLGVCAGIARYAGVDPVFVRLGAIVLALLTGFWPTIIVYLVAAALLPRDPAQETVATNQEPKEVYSSEPEEQSEQKQDNL